MTASSAPVKTVLIADDTPFVRERFTVALESAGHRAVTVKSAAELLARVRADLERLDLLVIDLRLPHVSGLDIIKSIRKMDNGRLPILVFSGTVSTAGEVRELASLGVSGYVNEYSAVQHILPSLAPHLFPELNVHVMASIPNGLWLEQMGWLDDIWVEPLAIKDGIATAPERPGHGLAIKPGLLAEHRVT